MQIQPQPIKQHAELPAGAGRQSAGLAQAGLFHGGQHGDQGFGDGDGESLGRSALGRGEGDRAGRQVDAVHGDLGFGQAASGGQTDFKGHAHPLLGRRHVSHGLADAGDLFVGKRGLDTLVGGVAEAVVVQVAHLPVAEEPPLAVDPFHDLDVPEGLVAVDGAAGDAAGGLGTPADVGLGLRGGKLFRRDAAVNQVELQPAPGVAVVNDRFEVGLVGQDKGQNPVVLDFGAPFVDRDAGGFFDGFGPVEGIAGHPRGGLGLPRALRGFESQPIVRAVVAGENGRHGTSVTNHQKTQQN